MPKSVVGRKLAFFFAAFFFCCESTAETIWNNWHVDVPEELDQLSNHAITLVRKTGPRKVWIASTEGIYFFDGRKTSKKLVPWASHSNAPVRRVINFASALNGSTYLFTKEDGIYKMPARGSQFDRISRSKNRDEFRKIKSATSSETNNSAIFISNDSVFSLQLDSSEIQEVIINTDSSYGPPIGLFSSNSGEVFVVYDELLVRLAWQRDRFVFQKQFRCRLNVQSITTETQITTGRFYITDNLGKLHKIQIGEQGCGTEPVPEVLEKTLIGSRVNAVMFLRRMGALAVSTDKGLLIYRQDSIQRISTDNSLMRSNEILTVEETSEAGMLIGSFRGIMHAKLRPFISINQLHLEQKPTVTAIARAQAFGTFLASTKGLYREVRQKEGVSFTPFDLQRSHSNLSALEITARGAWVGFQDGNLLFCDLHSDLKACDSLGKKSISKFPITSIVRLDDEEASVLVTTLEGQVFHARIVSNQIEIRMLLDTKDSEARLSAATLSGEYAWFLDLSEIRAVPLSKISASFQPKIRRVQLAQLGQPWAMVSVDNLIYFATPGGRVSLVSEDEFVLEKQAIPLWITALDETVFSIEVDSLKRPWVSTSNGLWMRHGNGNFQLEVKTHGTDAIASDYGASYSDDNGNLYFGGTGGVIYVNEPQRYPLDRSGSLAISKIWIDGEPIINGGEIRANNWILTTQSTQKDLSLEYGSTELFSKGLSGFEHKLEGFDNTWHDTGSVNVVTYQNLPPGDYTFRARGADAAGVWSDNEITLPIRVLPPVWRTWWALVGYFLLAVFLFKYLKTLNDRMVAQRERLRLAEEGSAAYARLEDDYQGQREANETLLLRRTTLAQQLLDVVEAAIMAPVTDSEAETARSLRSKISTLRTLQTLTDRTTSAERTDVHALTNEIAARLAQSSELAERSIITNAISKNPVPLEQALYLCLAIQEALEHAIMGRRYETSVDPMIYVAMDAPARDDSGEVQYELRIEDSGLMVNDETGLEKFMPLTLHLIESGGGEISDDHDAGNTLSVHLRFPASNSSWE